MDKITAKLLNALNDWVLNIADVILNASELEKITAAAIPVAACLIGSWLNRRIDKMSQRTWKAKFVDFIAPLLAAVISLILTSIAAMAFAMSGGAHNLLSFVFKLSVAWLVVRVVLLMSSRRAAGWLIALVIMPITLIHFFGLWEPVTEALKAIKFTAGDFKLSAFIVIKTLLAIIILFWLAGALVDLVDHRLKRMRGMHINNKTLMSKLFQILAYFVVFIIILQVLGISLTALSVFGGAVGVGIGFGLQKIASNFISGIILLFEKTVQVGDFIELPDGLTGSVSRTSARYTLITTFDNREVLIPNEDFITQRMVNWTYTDKRGRAEIVVGVAYDTDLEKALELVLAAARAHPQCSTTTPPTCYVTDFADSSINLLLHFWVDDVTDGRFGPKSDIMIAIHKAFKENGISIPFPQRDVHMIKDID